MANHRQRLLDSAQRLILAKGFPATRVDEICEGAKVTKGSFYHHFKSKDELALVLIDHYFTSLTEGLCVGEWQNQHDPMDRLSGFLDNAEKVVRGPLLRKGCLLGSFALDLSETHPQIRVEVEQRFNSLVDVIEPLLSAVFKSRGRSGSRLARTVASQFVSVLQGSIVLAKAYDDYGKVAEGVRCYRSMLVAQLQI